MDYIKAHAADGRRVLFFCACPIERECHRRTVATLLLRAAHARHVDLTVVEWPGGDPESRELRLTITQEKRARGRGKTIPLGARMPSDGLATLPWGSTVLVRHGEQVRPVLTGPAVFAGEWRLPKLDVANINVSDKAPFEVQARKLRAAWGANVRH